MDEYILEAQDLDYEYPDGTIALRGVSIKIEKGSKVAVLGSNGAGKSTLFLNLNGVLKPTRGKLFLKGKKVKYNHSFLTELRKNVGIVFQDPDTQLFSASVFQEVSFGPLNLKLSEEIVKDRVNTALEAVGISDIKDRPTHFLSYGQKKKVSIADILAMQPEVIIFDEPTACLDPKHAQNIIELFNDINKNGTTVILSTHNMDMAYSWADHLIVMKDGRVEGQGTPAEVFTDGKLLRLANLEKPAILEIYDELKKKGFFKGNASVPRSKSELLQMIKDM